MANIATADIKVMSEEVEQYLGSFPEESYDRAREIFLNRVMKAHDRVLKNLRLRMKIRTGNLSRATRFSVSGNDLKTLEGSLYVAHKQGGEEMAYARVQEYGSPPAGIKAKNAYKRVPGGPYLNIPLKDNKTPAGVMRMTPKMVFDAGGYLLQAKSKKWFVVLEGKGLMFILVKKVHVPARMGMRKAMDDQIPKLLADLKKEVAEEK